MKAAYHLVGAQLGAASGDVARIDAFRTHKGVETQADFIRAAVDALLRKQAASATLQDVLTELKALRAQQAQLLASGVQITPQAAYAESDLSALDGIL